MLGDFPFKAEYVLVKSEPLQGRSTWIYQLRALTEVINFVFLASHGGSHLQSQYLLGGGRCIIVESMRPAWVIQ